MSLLPPVCAPTLKLVDVLVEDLQVERIVRLLEVGVWAPDAGVRLDQ
jgi:hypothetical protein